MRYRIPRDGVPGSIDELSRTPRHPAVTRVIAGLAPLTTVAIAVVLVACSSTSAPRNTGTSPSTSLPPVVLGQRLFDTGVGADGRAISRSGATSMMGMMGNAGCVSCHGPDGRGRSTPMVQAPDITYGNLTDPAGMRELDGSRGHVYTDALIRRAVTEGVGADGDQLSAQMPRWQLTDADWAALLAYLKRLS